MLYTYWQLVVPLVEGQGGHGAHEMLFPVAGVPKCTVIRLWALNVLSVILQHWAKRMGNKNINVKTSRGANMSTVGVDIGDWVFEKKIRGQSSYGPVVFRYCLMSRCIFCSYLEWCLSFRSSNHYFILFSSFISCLYKSQTTMQGEE